jgi:GntP family gluconate:H+ symporter
MLIPVVLLAVKRTGKPLMLLGIPAVAGLSVLHGLVPPHPGPLIAISAVHAELATTLGLGLIIAVVTVVVCGPLLSLVLAKAVPVGAPQRAGGVDVTSSTSGPEVSRRPSFGITLGTILFPVVLMLSKGLADIIDTDATHPSTARTVFDFIGEPLVALTLAVLVAMVTFGYSLQRRGSTIASRINASVGPVASVILIVGAGGGFKQTLIGAGVGRSVAKLADHSHLSVLVLGYLIAVALRLATGSATVATITAAGIVAPLAGDLSSSHTALLALAIGAGSLFLSHVNDAGFWLVKESFGLTVGQTFRSWSVMETAVSLVGFGSVMLLSALL